MSPKWIVMYAPHQSALLQFKQEVGTKFQLYNSLFTALPFHKIEKTGVLLSLFLMACEEGFVKGQSPAQIIQHFFQQHMPDAGATQQVDVLFRFIQYCERQVVLFDAIEDAAFKLVHDLNGPGTLADLSPFTRQWSEADVEKALQGLSVRLVLTAHPTQFYPGAVLGIIHDLSKAIVKNDVTLINAYLQQLGKTPFLLREKPTPLDEANSLIWYLENVFYPTAGRIQRRMRAHFPVLSDRPQWMQMGFWPGGDRDGNPFVKAETTLQVARALRGAILKCYYADVRKLKRRLTFRGVEQLVSALEQVLYQQLFLDVKEPIQMQDIVGPLREIRQVLIEQHSGFFVEGVDDLLDKVALFGLHFAALDIRQESKVHARLWAHFYAIEKSTHEHAYAQLSEAEKLAWLDQYAGGMEWLEADPVGLDTLALGPVIQKIQQENGPSSCHRYIISQCQSASHVMEVYRLLQATGTQMNRMDIVPLFETIGDLKAADQIMESLFAWPSYRSHLRTRGEVQTIMLGFSDGTKDGGYLTANWNIFLAKNRLTSMCKRYGIAVVFFDGRGGPPARGGGKTHQFYASMGKDIANREIQLTIQGQTISSNFGTLDSAQYNIEQLLQAGMRSRLRKPDLDTLTLAQTDLLETLSQSALQAYLALRDDPQFLDYLQEVSPLRFYSDTNIGSRPARRSAHARLELSDLRAIPFVGAWSQLKQNVTGYYGVGTALESAHAAGRWSDLQQCYQENAFFRTLVDNCEMAMMKCYFPLTRYLEQDPRYTEIWTKLYEEYERTRHYLSLLTGHTDLMHRYPVEQLSVQMRERIILPLTTIQQYGLMQLRDDSGLHSTVSAEVWQKLVVRTSFGIINAGRNSA